jgi:hypothetical protein
VDGGVKPGHDASESRLRSLPYPEPTSTNSYRYKRREFPCQNQKWVLHRFSLAESIRLADRRAQVEKLRLFETLRPQPAARVEAGGTFPYFFARNPLKTPDSKK